MRESKLEWTQRLETLPNPNAQILGEDILEAPPEYQEIVGITSTSMQVWHTIRIVAAWLQGEYRRAMRPRLKPGCARLEWTCVESWLSILMIQQTDFIRIAAIFFSATSRENPPEGLQTLLPGSELRY